MRQNISCISSIKMCSSCGACISVCPKKAISFGVTSLGRMFANVDGNCVECGLCLKVCPSYILNGTYEDFFNLKKKNIVVGKACNRNFHLNGQSGGAVTAILSYLFKSRKIDAALVCNTSKGAPFIVKSEQQLKDTQKSVYTPIPMLVLLDEIRSYKSIAVVGLPCHLSGLANVLKYKPIPIKYKLGLICDRALCGAIASGIKNYYNEKKVKDIVIKYRDKLAGVGYGYSNAPISVYSSGKQIGIISSSVRQKLKQIFTAPRCLVCPDKLNVSADLVFGDPWNIKLLDENGESLIIANTQEGCDLLNQAIKNRDLVLSCKCSSADLDKSQHISQRREQVAVYSWLLSRHSNVSFLLKSHNGMKIRLQQCCRALYCIFRFRLLEILPEEIVKKYIVRIIKRMVKNNE